MNRPILTVLALAAPLAVVAAPRSSDTPARALSGRVAGKAEQCLPSFFARGPGETFRDGSVIYKGQGSRWYVTHLDACPQLRPGTAIVSRVNSGSLCRGDIVQIVDPRASAFPGDPRTATPLGSCALGDFVPYDRAAH